MRLRKQLFIVSLFLLVLPVSGFLYIREMEMVLRFGQEQAATATAQAIADRITSDAQLSDTFRQENEKNTAPLFKSLDFDRSSPELFHSVYTHSVDSDIILDGYDDDWLGLGFTYLSLHSSNLTLVSANKGDHVYLFAKIKVNSSLNYHNPSIDFPASGDYLLLSSMVDGLKNTNFVLRTSSPGRIQAVYKRGNKIFQEFQIQGIWRENLEGFQIELRVPKQLLGDYLGLALFRGSDKSIVGNFQATYANHHFKAINLPSVKSESSQVNAVIKSFVHDNNRLYLLDRKGWIVAGYDALTPPGFDVREIKQNNYQLDNVKTKETPFFNWLMRLAVSTREFPGYDIKAHNAGMLSSKEIALAVKSKTAVSQWYNLDVDSNLVRSSVPIISSNGDVLGAVVLEQTNDAWWRFTNIAVAQLFVYSFVALLIAGLTVLFYASWLSYRVRSLNKYVKKSIQSDGTINYDFPRSTFNDEIGDLNRSYIDLLKNVDEYNDYLRTLSGKLSHELRTPIAVVKSSLDNLESLNADSRVKTYIKRAQEGTSRLSNILTSMNSAKQVEDAIKNTEFESIPLTRLIEDIGQAYTELAKERNRALVVENNTDIQQYQCAPELLVQMLDKLFENALDFCPDQGEIQLSLTDMTSYYQIVVSNDGPLLPENMRGQIFDSLVSLRDKSVKNTSQDAGKLHLGLGLFIVRLVVDVHKGRITARNKIDASGVEFVIQLPN